MAIQIINSERRKKIIVELIGGTGNQLFQLSACYKFGKIFEREIYYTDKLLDGNRKLETKNIAAELGFRYVNSMEIRNLKLLREEDLIHPAYFSLYPEKNYLPKEDIILSGYFQNHKIHEIECIKKIKEIAKLNFRKFKINEDYIAFHTRELQASNNNKPLKNIDNLNIKYYERSLKIIKDQLETNNQRMKNIYLFSDTFKNRKYSKIIDSINKLAKKNNFNLIMGDDLCRTAWDSISIMSQSKYIVTSNSTFSWWAGYLSEAKVFSPILSLWETRLTTPDNWLQVNDDNLSPKPWHNLSIYKKEKIILTKRKYQFKLIRKIKHIFTYYIFKNSFINKKEKNNNLKIRNLLN